MWPLSSFGFRSPRPPGGHWGELASEGASTRGRTGKTGGNLQRCYSLSHSPFPRLNA